MTLDTKKLQILVEDLARDAKHYNESTIDKAADDNWNKLVNGSLLELQKYLEEIKSEKGR